MERKGLTEKKQFMALQAEGSKLQAAAISLPSFWPFVFYPVSSIPRVGTSIIHTLNLGITFLIHILIP